MSGETAPGTIGRGYARNRNVGSFRPMIGSFDLHLRARSRHHHRWRAVRSAVGMQGQRVPIRLAPVSVL